MRKNLFFEKMTFHWPAVRRYKIQFLVFDTVPISTVFWEERNCNSFFCADRHAGFWISFQLLVTRLRHERADPPGDLLDQRRISFPIPSDTKTLVLMTSPPSKWLEMLQVKWLSVQAALLSPFLVWHFLRGPSRYLQFGAHSRNSGNCIQKRKLNSNWHCSSMTTCTHVNFCHRQRLKICVNCTARNCVSYDTRGEHNIPSWFSSIELDAGISSRSD